MDRRLNLSVGESVSVFHHRTCLSGCGKGEMIHIIPHCISGRHFRFSNAILKANGNVFGKTRNSIAAGNRGFDHGSCGHKDFAIGIQDV